MAHWQDGYVTVGDLRLHYTRTGGSKPPLVLLHGLTDDGLCWGEFATDLAADYDVIMPDARGHGLSDGEDIALDLDAMVDETAAILRALKLPPAYVIGHSMGGITALYLTGRHPDLVRSTVLEDPATTRMRRSEEEWKTVAAQRRAALVASRAKSRDQHIADLKAQNPHWRDGEIARWADARPHVRANTGSFLAELPRESWEEILAQVRVPVLLLRPDPGKGITTEDSAAEMVQLQPLVEVVHIPQTGHCLRRDQPTEYERIVREFMART